MVLSGGELDRRSGRGLQELFRNIDGGAAQVFKRIIVVQWNSFHRLAKVWEEGELEKEDMPAWTGKVNAIIWQEVLEDVEANNAYTKIIIWRCTNFLRHVVSEKEGRGAITFTCVCERCKLLPVEVFLWW